ncbi:hypothetical protein [Thermomonospora echinospora]|nr:hypothetical protein [Thermomonospora echinospora]
MADHWPPTRPWPTTGQEYGQLVVIEPTPPDGWRSNKVTMYLREASYKVMQSAFDGAGIGWQSCLVQARGNGALVLVPAQTPPQASAEPLITGLAAGIRAHNRLHNESAWLRMRMAVHMGIVCFDPAGPAGRAVQLAGALVDSAEFAGACADNCAELGFIASDQVYAEVLREPGLLIEPEMYRPIKLVAQGERILAWTYFRPSPPRPGVTRPYPVKEGVGGDARGWDADEVA